MFYGFRSNWKGVELFQRDLVSLVWFYFVILLLHKGDIWNGTAVDFCRNQSVIMKCHVSIWYHQWCAVNSVQKNLSNRGLTVWIWLSGMVKLGSWNLLKKIPHNMKSAKSFSLRHKVSQQSQSKLVRMYYTFFPNRSFKKCWFKFCDKILIKICSILWYTYLDNFKSINLRIILIQRIS